MRIFFVGHLKYLLQAKEEEVKRKQREVEAAMRILDRLVDN